MDAGGSFGPRLLAVLSACVCVATGRLPAATVINCNSGGGPLELDPVNEGYSGEVEVVSGIVGGSGVKLVPYYFPAHLQFLELIFEPGGSAIVHTVKELDAEALSGTDGGLYYSIMCDGTRKYNHTRILKVNDLNDHRPTFPQAHYSATVSEIAEVGEEVFRVTAVDGDISPQHSAMSYSLTPTSQDFTLTNSGAFILKRRLNYNLVSQYSFTVTAQDNGGLRDTTSVTINVQDFDNLNPYFSHSTYWATIPEEEVGPLRTVEPAPIRAQDGDTGLNVTLTYSISAVSPSKYEGNFHIDPGSGVVSVVAALDREEMDSSVISVSIKAAQTDDSLKTADAAVSVTVEDVNDNQPEFDRPEYRAALLENSPVGAVAFKAVVSDPDQGGFVGTLRIVPESAPFSIEPDGTVRVKTPAALDREAVGSFAFRIEAAESNPPNTVIGVPVNVTLLDENDNSPVFTASMYVGHVSADQHVGMLLVQVKAEDLDADANGRITYSIEFGNNDGYFSIDGDTGNIVLVKLIPLVENQVLHFPLYVTARDGGVISRSSSAQVKIQAPGNSRPQFFQKVFHGTVEEEQNPGVGIVKVKFFALESEPPPTLRVDTETDKFSILSSGEFATKVKLDYDDGPHNYSVSISVSDGVTSDTAVVEVQVTDVNDNSPVFSPSSVTKSVPEDAEVGTNVTVVPATDKDSSFNQEVRYSLRGGEGRFAIDPVSGTVSVASALDREAKAEYDLLVVAEDQGRPVRSATASLLVQVSDVNDNVPKFSQAEYQLLVSETEAVDTSLLTLSAADADDGANGRVSYSIFQQSPSSEPAVFELDSSSGTLRLAQPLDYSEVKMYSLMVQASDGGAPSLVGNSSVVVKVKDVNDNPPEFSKESYDVAVSENLASGASILSLQVTDKDEGGFVGTLRILPESAPFSISSDGTIRVKDSTALDRETTERIQFQVEAKEKEPPNHVVLVTVNVTLLDENDNGPEFTSSKYESKIFTNQTEGMLVVKVEAEDQDAGVNGQITYSIDFGNQNNYFSIDENTGEITLTKIIPLDAHQTLESLLFITARDGGAVSRAASAQVEVLAVGDTKPAFTQRTYSCTTEEERDPGTVIFKVGFLATGEPPVTLQVDTETDKFSILSSGEFATKVKLDYDDGPHNYSVSISISDGVNSDTAVVEVQVTDVNDNSPVFSPSSVTKSVPEDAEVGTNVTVVPATDKDSSFNQEVRYSLRGGEGRFAIDPVSGTVSVASALDREAKAEYELLVVAEDQGRPVRSATASLLVQVSDVNDNVPKFSQAEYQLLVSETEAVDTSLLTLSAADADDGANGRVSYSIFQQSPSSEPAVFELDSSSGTLRLAQPLDFSEVKMYSLMVQASDGGAPSLVGNSSVVVKVKDVNDNPPEFSKESYDVAVSENLASGASILSLQVTDKDEGGFVGTLRILPESAPFSISSDGTIRVKDSTALDRETTERIQFQVEAKEKEPPNHVVLVTVNVTLLDENDNGPEFTSSKYESKIFTNQTEGMLVVKVEAEDQDAGVNGQITYSIDFGNQNNYFSIDENTGEITLTKIIPLDAHQTLESLLFITARDGGAVSRAASAQVEVLAVGDTKPAFTQRTYSCTTEEERDPGTVIFKVGFLATGEPPVTLQVDTETDKFSILSSGELTTKVKLDYDDGPHNYSVSISISDGVNSDTAVVEVQVTDVNDNSPVFSPSSVTKSVPEDAEVGTNVTVVPATDKDSSFNQEVRYSLRGGEGRFAIDPVSGTVSVASALDREAKAEYELLVVAEDQGRPVRSATASLLVQVSDVNDNVPKFSQAEYQLLVSETEAVDTSLLTLSAADADDGANGRVSYSIFQQSPSSEPAVFELDSSSGTLRLAQPLDFSEVKMYSLMVQASDGGAPSLVGNSSVVVKVKDVNDNPPEFSKESYDVAVSENLASGASILSLQVTDKDEGGFSGGFFLFTDETFDINKQGVMSLRKDVTLDRETKDRYLFQVVAVDQRTGGLSSTAQVNVTVLDYNDNAPQFPAVPEPLRILEGNYSEETPGEVFTFRLTDADLGAAGEVTLSLASPHPLFRFTQDGTLLVVGCLDREVKDAYELVIRASDGGSPQRENVTAVRLSVGDVNDNPPEFSSRSFAGSVLLKDAEEGKVLLTLSAADRDSGSNALITYSFSEGSSPHLALDADTGAVTLTSDLADVTEDTTLVLTAKAEDHGRPPLSSTARVIVDLRVVSLVDGVAFGSSSYNFSVAENQAGGAAAGRVWASAGSDLYQVAYSLRTQGHLFSVDAGGAVKTRAPLDREEQEWYVLDVEAVDTRTPPTTAVTVVTVQVEDVNEPPLFPPRVHEASVFSIAPYKTPVLRVEASDPDVADQGRLVYSLSAGGPHFDVEPSSGLVFVVSAADLSGGHTLEVTAADPRGLKASVQVKVEVQGAASSSDLVFVTLNRPANAVEKKVSQLETSLGSALGWTVKVIQVSGSGGAAPTSRSLTTAETLVSFVCLDGPDVVPSADVTKKLQSQSAAVSAELAQLFGDGLHFDVEAEPQRPQNDQTVAIALGAMLALSMLGLIVTVSLIIRFKLSQKHSSDSDKETLDLHGDGYTNWTEETPETPEQKNERRWTDADVWTTETDDKPVTFKQETQTDDDDDEDDDEGHTSAL